MRLSPKWRDRAFGLLLALFLICVTGEILSRAVRTDVVIEPISVSAGVDRAGFSSSAFTNELGDQIDEFEQMVNTLQASHISPATELPELEVPEAKISLKALIQFLEVYVPLLPKPIRVSGDASRQPDGIHISFHVRRKK